MAVRRGSTVVSNKPFPTSPGPLHQNDVKSSAFDMEMLFHSHANKSHFRKKSCALGLLLKVRVFGTREWPIIFPETGFYPVRAKSWGIKIMERTSKLHVCILFLCKIAKHKTHIQIVFP